MTVRRSAFERRYWLLYVAWIAVCAVAFLALRGAEDPSRPTGRLTSPEAGAIALASLQKSDPVSYHGFEVVSVAHASAGEGGREDRWVVLCDRSERTMLRDAVVVELDGRTGRLLRIRPPDPGGK